MRRLKKLFALLPIYVFLIALFMVSPRMVIDFDENLFITINSLSGTLLDYLFYAITFFGSSIFWALMIILFWLKDKRNLSIHVFYAYILDLFFILVLKFGFYRPRPTEFFSGLNLIDYDLGPSFPSGHTQKAFSSIAVLSVYYPRIRIPLFVLAVLVGISRIYLGYHFPLDVLIGGLNGIIIGYSVLYWPIQEIKKRLNKIYKPIQKLILR